MKAISLVFFFLFCLPAIQAQSDTVKRDKNYVDYSSKGNKLVVDAIIVNGDTIPIMVLDEVLLVPTPTFDSYEARRRFYILKRRVIKVYPYAVIAGNKLDSLNLLLKPLKSRRKKKKLIKDFQTYLEDRFEEELKSLTRSEGQILSKLIFRETNMTSYELISTYRSGWNAFWWNVAAGYYNIDLKTPYDPQEIDEDRLIEIILKQAFAQGMLEERQSILSLN